MGKYNRAQQKAAMQRVAIKLPDAIEKAEIEQKVEMIRLDLLFGGPIIPAVRRIA